MAKFKQIISPTRMDDFEEDNDNYMWVLVNGVIDVEKEIKNTIAHLEVDRWWDNNSGKKSNIYCKTSRWGLSV